MSYALSGSIGALRCRAQMLARTRQFFADRDVLEVETPALSSAGNTDPAIGSISATVSRLSGKRHYLHTSPEFAMKRLLAAGTGDIYQLCRVFRKDELGRWHQPEFTMLEWYRTGWTEQQLMTEVEALIRHVLGDRGKVLASVRRSYRDALNQALDCSADDPRTIEARLRDRAVDVPADLELNQLLDLALAAAVIPSLAPATIQFIYDYPAGQAALAQLKRGDPPVARRFEAFVDGIELANGYLELTDADECLRRFEDDNRLRRSRDMEVVPIDQDLIDALRAGLPQCAGVAVGFDRLVAIGVGSDNVAGAIGFAHTDDPC